MFSFAEKSVEMTRNRTRVRTPFWTTAQHTCAGLIGPATCILWFYVLAGNIKFCGSCMDFVVIGHVGEILLLTVLFHVYK